MGFRGADASLMTHMVEKMSTSSGAGGNFSRRILSVNRRSSSNVIDLINLVSRHTFKPRNYDETEALTAIDEDSFGKCGLWVSSSEGVQDRTTDNLNCAAFGIVKLLKEKTEVKPKDIVVLVRKIRSATAIQKNLGQLGVAARIVSGAGFFQQQEVVDLLSALRLITNPSDSLALAIVLRSPLVMLEDQEILRLTGSGTTSLNVPNAVMALSSGWLTPCSQERLARFLDTLEKLRILIVTKGLMTALDALIDDCDFAFAIGVNDNPHQKWANVKKLSTMFAKETRNPSDAIDDYFTRIFEDRKEPEATDQMEPNAVNIMTIHQSKGLEFKIVVLADGEGTLVENYGEFLVDRQYGVTLKPRGRLIAACGPKDAGEKSFAKTRFEGLRELQKIKDLEEVARLLYVALTRAKDELYVVSSNKSFFERAHDDSLLGLFLRAFKYDKNDFLKVCEIEHVMRPGPLVSSQPKYSPPDTVKVFQNTTLKTRIFASALRVSLSSKIPTLVNHDIIKKLPIIDGNLAHQLLAAAGDMLFLRDDGPSLERVVDAAFRALGCEASQENLSVKSQVIPTLEALRRAFRSAKQIIFEMPLCCWALPTVMIEGFADIVVEFEEFVGVIELKSSVRLAIDPNTYFQVLAYAHGLNAHFNKPVKFAVLLIGSSKTPKWREYDDFAHSLFVEEVKEGTLPVS